jgi:uncharacterized FlaG/YvyC family protein
MYNFRLPSLSSEEDIPNNASGIGEPIKAEIGKIIVTSGNGQQEELKKTEQEEGELKKTEQEEADKLQLNNDETSDNIQSQINKAVEQVETSFFMVLDFDDE